VCRKMLISAWPKNKASKSAAAKTLTNGPSSGKCRNLQGETVSIPSWSQRACCRHENLMNPCHCFNRTACRGLVAGRAVIDENVRELKLRKSKILDRPDTSGCIEQAIARGGTEAEGRAASRHADQTRSASSRRRRSRQGIRDRAGFRAASAEYLFPWLASLVLFERAIGPRRQMAQTAKFWR